MELQIPLQWLDNIVKPRVNAVFQVVIMNEAVAVVLTAMLQAINANQSSAPTMRRQSKANALAMLRLTAPMQPFVTRLEHEDFASPFVVQVARHPVQEAAPVHHCGSGPKVDAERNVPANGSATKKVYAISTLLL